MFTPSNFLTFLRGPLAFLFLIDNSGVRFGAVLAAMLTDMIDGYIARRSKTTTEFGALLDPLMDKFFVFFIVSVLLYEGKLTPFHLTLMLTRDISLIIFGVYLFFRKQLDTKSMKPAWCGKASTALQFLTLVALTLGYKVPGGVYYLFAVLGVGVLIELCFTYKVKH